MSVRSPAFSHCARRAVQRGAAVVLALLTVSFAAMLAAAALADFGHGLAMLGGRHDQAQAWQLARAAVDWSRNILADDARRTPNDHLGEIWTTEIPVTAIGSDPADGSVGGAIRDLSGRFNLNDLAPRGSPDRYAIARFARLLVLIGMNSSSANGTAQALAHHLQASSTAPGSENGTEARTHTRSASALIEPRELVLTGLLSAADFTALEPHIFCAPSAGPININTASAEVLAAMVDGLSLDAARNLVAERERAWFRDLGDLQVRLPEGARLSAGGRLDVRSRYFLVTVTAAYGDAVLNLQAMLDRESNWPAILWYHTP